MFGNLVIEICFCEGISDILVFKIFDVIVFICGVFFLVCDVEFFKFFCFKFIKDVGCGVLVVRLREGKVVIVCLDMKNLYLNIFM